jgi:nitrilase
MCETARKRKIWLAGSLLIKGDAPLPHNTCVLVGPDGVIRTQYRKIHLFDMPGVAVESKVMAAGRDTVTTEIDGWRVGFAICFDLRFPALFAEQKADLYLVPSAFSAANGPAHWHLLVKARAVERQAYVVAPNQEGKLSTGMETWGHSLIVDPWGEVLAESKGEGAIATDITRERLAEIRKRLPM